MIGHPKGRSLLVINSISSRNSAHWTHISCPSSRLRNTPVKAEDKSCCKQVFSPPDSWYRSNHVRFLQIYLYRGQDFLLFFVNFMEDIRSFFEDTDTPALDFWWCLPWVQSQVGFPRRTDFSDSPLVQHLLTLVVEPLWSTYLHIYTHSSFYDFWIESRRNNLISWIQVILKNYLCVVLLTFHRKLWHLFTE